MPKYNTEEYEKFEEELKLAKGFDRGIDYEDIKKKLINKYIELQKQLQEHYENDNSKNDKTKNKAFNNKNRILHNKIIYCLTSMLQLKNGCRIIEACASIKVFFKKNILDKRIIVKIAKSECIKKKKETGEEYITPRRNREIVFPNKWINFELTDTFKIYLDMISIKQLKQRVLMFLLREFECNTHSLRYSFINYMLYKRKQEITLVSKVVGHVNCNQLVRYTSNINAGKILDIDD